MARLVFWWQMNVIFALTTSALHGEAAGLAGEVPLSATQDSVALLNFWDASSEFGGKDGGRGQSNKAVGQHVDEDVNLGSRITKRKLSSAGHRYITS